MKKNKKRKRKRSKQCHLRIFMNFRYNFFGSIIYIYKYI